MKRLTAAALAAVFTFVLVVPIAARADKVLLTRPFQIVGNGLIGPFPTSSASQCTWIFNVVTGTPNVQVFGSGDRYGPFTSATYVPATTFGVNSNITPTVNGYFQGNMSQFPMGIGGQVTGNGGNTLQGSVICTDVSSGSGGGAAYQVGGTLGSVLQAAPIPKNIANLNGALSTCVTVTSSAAVAFYFYFAGTAAQTGQITIYNDAGTCAAGDAIYTSAAHATMKTPDLLYFPAPNGLSYEWTTAICLGNCFLAY